MATTIVLAGLNKTIRTINTLTDINLTLDGPSLIGLIGDNGAGKSTLLKILCGLMRPSSGHISFFGQASQSFDRMQIGYMPDKSYLADGLSAYENLYLRCLEWGLPTSIVTCALAEVELEHVAHMKCKKFSFGIKRRLDFAIARLGNPRILLLDEPFNGLDPSAVASFCKLLRSHKQSSTIVVSSHNLHELSSISDRIIMLDHGYITYDTTVAYKKQCISQDLLVQEDGPQAQTPTVIDAEAIYRAAHQGR